jgi:starch-binding outer membrane protein, SusD/RagB family
MKNINILLLAGIILFGGCKDQLKEEVYGALSDLNSVENINAATVGIYQAVENGGGIFHTNAFFPMVETGHRYSSYGSTNENLGNRDFYKYIYNPNTAALNTTWASLYRMVNRANEVIEAAQNIKDTTVANPLIAEARFLRGWAYFTLTQFWGPVPLHLKSTSSSGDKSNVYLARSPIADVYAQIVDDLKYASTIHANGKPRLVRTRPTNELGRVTSGSALALLGKVYLTMAGRPLSNKAAYTDAVNTFATLVSQRKAFGTDLLPKGSYGNIFTVANEMNAEVLFALRSFANTATIAAGSYFPNAMAPVASSVDIDLYSPTPNYGVRADILRLFEPTDVRSKEGIGGSYPDMRANSMITVNGALVRDSVVYDTVQLRYVRKSIPTSTLTANVGYGIGFTKHKADVARATPSVRAYNNDWIVLRFADVLLSYAEALNESGQTSAAIPFLNEVRARANASLIPTTTTQAALQKIIREERTRELIGEFTSVFDMRRWGTLKENMDDYTAAQLSTPDKIVPVFNEKFYLYPVPFEQIIANPLLSPQNTGW